jgi:hypothetical protein
MSNYAGRGFTYTDFYQTPRQERKAMQTHAVAAHADVYVNHVLLPLSTPPSFLPLSEKRFSLSMGWIDIPLHAKGLHMTVQVTPDTKGHDILVQHLASRCKDGTLPLRVIVGTHGVIYGNVLVEKCGSPYVYSLQSCGEVRWVEAEDKVGTLAQMLHTLVRG